MPEDGVSPDSEEDLVLEDQIIVNEDRFEQLQTRAALVEDLEQENERLKEKLEEREEQIETVDQAYSAALSEEGPHSETFYEDVPLHEKRVELDRLRGGDQAALAEYKTSDTVSYGQGEKKTGVVLEVLTSDTTVPTGEDSDKEVEASQDSPKYVVALGHSDGFKVFSGSELSSGEINIDDLDDPKEDLKDEKAANEFIGTERTDENGEVAALDWSYPRSWRKSKKPNRLILLDAWTSMGGTFRSCYPRYGGKRFCASMKDKVWGTTYWRRFND